MYGDCDSERVRECSKMYNNLRLCMHAKYILACVRSAIILMVATSSGKQHMPCGAVPFGKVLSISHYAKSSDLEV